MWAKPLTKVPDYMSPLVGWRVWSGYDPHTLGLKALSNSFYWLPGKPLTAKCDCCGSPCKPSMGNSQGFYAFESLAVLIRQQTHVAYGRHFLGQNTTHHLPIVGQCYMWGTVVECEFGYRAEHAYPKALLVGDESVRERLKEKWNIEIEVGDIERIVRDIIKNIGGTLA